MVVARFLLRVKDNLNQATFWNYSNPNFRLKMRFHIAIVMIIMSITAGDLIGWNRTRNTAHKHMFVRNKVDTIALLNQYRNFQKIQKLNSLVVKNIGKRARGNWEPFAVNETLKINSIIRNNIFSKSKSNCPKSQ